MYTKQMLENILMLYNNNILHKNLKLSNIMMFDEDVVKLSDFALRICFEGDHRMTESIFLLVPP